MFDVDSDNLRILFVPTNEDVGVHYIGLNISDGELYDTMDFEATVDNLNDGPELTKVGGKNAGVASIIELSATEDTWNNFTVFRCTRR